MPIQTPASKKQTLSSLLIPGLIGVFFFWLYTGGHILAPENLKWILASNGDPVQHYVGWNFFRNAPFFQWPFGKNLSYGEQLGSSIVFTDSIPLLAFIFRPFSEILPEPFQYFGMWILLCFMLQAVFAWALLSHFIHDKLLLTISTAFFVLSPPMIWRFSGHEALMGHWLILAALCIYLADRRKLVLWPLLLCVATLVHAYLCAMCAAIWLADVIRRRYFKTATSRELSLEVIVSLACLAFVMTFAGYFVSKSVSAGGFGSFRMNLLSFVEPGPIWSAFYSTQYNGGDYEGFAFLGVGTLILAALTLVSMYRSRKPIPRNKYLIAPLAILSGLLVLYALSDHISFGPFDLFNYRLPKIAQKITATFRVSGRFVWPVFYLLELSIFYIFIRNVARKPATIILALLLVVQGVDVVGAKANHVLKQRWYGDYAWPLNSTFWADAAKTYRRIAFIIPTEDTPDSGVLLTYASNNRMSTNGGSIARVSSVELDKVQEALRQEVATNHYRDDTLYFFTRDELWNEAIDKFRDGFIGIVDGYRVLAPHWKGCTAACGAVQASPMHSIEVSRMIDLTGSLDWMSMQNWSSPDPDGRWTDGKQASLRIYVGRPRSEHIRVLVDLHAFVRKTHPSQTATVSINGQPYATWKFSDQSDVTKEIAVDSNILSKSNGELQISFDLPDATSPESIGMKGDKRMLGLSVKRISLSSY